MPKHKKPAAPGELHVRRKELSMFVELRLDRFLREEVVPSMEVISDAVQQYIDENIERLVVAKLAEAGYRVAAVPGGLVGADGAAISTAAPVLVGASGEPLEGSRT
jgi:hypothetical protein